MPLACAAAKFGAAGDGDLEYPGEALNPAIREGCEGGKGEPVAGAPVPPATEAIAEGVACELGGTGKADVGPLSASTSAAGSFFLSVSRFRPDMEHPDETIPASVQVVTTKIVRLVFLSILPTYDT